MALLDFIEVRSNGQFRRIELHHGDLTDLPPGDAVDLLILSAFPNDYTPTPRSLIGALHRRGLPVRELARQKADDLRDSFSCWLSQEVRPSYPGIRFRRILCFEPHVRGAAPEVVGDIFRALWAVVGSGHSIRTAAMPIVAAGDQGYSISAMLPPLIEAAVRWLEIGAPLESLKIFAYSDSSAREAQELFARLKSQLAPSAATTSSFEYDVFISYARANSDAANVMREQLERHSLRLFIDVQDLKRGAAWQSQIFNALDSCARMIALYSPAYVASKVCQEEFNIAWMRGRDQDLQLIVPIYWQSANLPTYMKLLNYVDCRETRSNTLADACDALARELKA